MDEETTVYQLVFECLGIDKALADIPAVTNFIAIQGEAAVTAGRKLDIMGAALLSVSKDAMELAKDGKEVTGMFEKLSRQVGSYSKEAFDKLSFAIHNNVKELTDLTRDAVGANAAMEHLAESSRAASLAAAEATNASTARPGQARAAFETISADATKHAADAMGALHLATLNEIKDLAPFKAAVEATEAELQRIAEVTEKVNVILGRNIEVVAEVTRSFKELAAGASQGVVTAMDELRLAVLDDMKDLQPFIDALYAAEAEERRLGDITYTVNDLLGRNAEVTVKATAAMKEWEGPLAHIASLSERTAEIQTKLNAALELSAISFLEEGHGLDAATVSATEYYRQLLLVNDAQARAKAEAISGIGANTVGPGAAGVVFDATQAERAKAVADAFKQIALAQSQGLPITQEMNDQYAAATAAQEKFQSSVTRTNELLGINQKEESASAELAQRMAVAKNALTEAQAQHTLAILREDGALESYRTTTLSAQLEVDALTAAISRQKAAMTTEDSEAIKVAAANLEYATAKKKVADLQILAAQATLKESESYDTLIASLKAARGELAQWDLSLAKNAEVTDSAIVSNSLYKHSLDAAGQSARIGAEGLNGWNLGILLSRGNLVALGAVMAVLTEKYFIDFQSGLADLRGNTGQSAAQLAIMRGEILQLGAEGPISLDDITVAFRHASDEGFRNADAMKVVTAGWKGAIATGGDAASVTNTLATEMSNFRVSADGAETAMGTLLVGAQQGNQTLDQLVSSLSKVGPTAASIHMPMSDAVALVSELTRATGNSSIAQTYSEGILTHIINPTKTATSLMEELRQATGVDLLKTFHDFTQGAISFQTVMERVKAATQGNQSEVMALFGGIRGGIGALQLMNGGLEQYIGIADKAKNGAKDLNDNFKQQQDTIKNKMLTAWDNAKEHLIEFAGAANKAADAINRLNTTPPKKGGSGGGSWWDNLPGNIAKDTTGAVNSLIPGARFIEEFFSNSAAPKKKTVEPSVDELKKQADQLQNNIRYIDGLRDAGVATRAELQSAHDQWVKEMEIRKRISEITQEQTEKTHAHTIALMNDAKASESYGSSAGVTIPLSGKDIQNNFNNAQTAYQEAAIKLAFDEINKHTKFLAADNAAVEKTRNTFVDYQKVMDAANKMTKDTIKNGDALQGAQADLTALESKAANEFWKTGKILPETQKEIEATNAKITAYQKALQALLQSTDAMTAAQAGLQIATNAAYNDVSKYGHILPEHQAAILADTLKIQAMQEAVARVTVELENAKWSKFGPQELQQSGAITALQQANQIADNQLGLTAEQKAVQDASYALQEAQHQVALDQLKLTEIKDDPNHTKQQVAEAVAAVRTDQGAVSVAQSNLSAANAQEAIAVTKQHYSILEQGVQSQIDQLTHQSTMIGLSTAMTANEKTVLQDQLAIQIDQKQIALDHLKLDADRATHADKATIAGDVASINRDLGKAGEDTVALANAQKAEAATHYTDAWAKKISDATARVTEIQSEVQTKIYDLAHNIPDKLPSLATLQGQFNDAQKVLLGFTSAAALAAKALGLVAEAGGKEGSGGRGEGNGNGRALRGGGTDVPSTFGLPGLHRADPGSFGGFGFGDQHFGLPSDAQIGAMTAAKAQALEAHKEQVLQNQIDDLRHQSVLIGQDVTLTADQKKIDQDILQIKMDQKQTLLDQAKLDALKRDPNATKEQIAAARETVKNDNRKTDEDTGQLTSDTYQQGINELGQVISNFQQSQSQQQSIFNAKQTIIADQSAIAVQKLTTIAQLTQDEVGIIQAQSSLASARSSAQTTQIQDQNAINAAARQIALDSLTAQKTMIDDVRSGDAQKMALDQAIAAAQLRVDEDALAIAQAQLAMDMQLGVDQIKIAEDGVQTAQDKEKADAAAAEFQAKILVDQLAVDNAQLQVAIDNGRLLQLQAQIANNSLALQAGAQTPFTNALNDLITQIGGDNKSLMGFQKTLGDDQQAANTNAANWSISLGNDAKQQALDQAKLAMDQGNWQQAIAILQGQMGADQSQVSLLQGQEGILQSIRDAAVQQLAIQGEHLHTQNLGLEHQKAMIDLRTDLTDSQKNLLKLQLDTQEDSLTVQQDTLKLQQVLASGGDPLAILQAQNQILADQYKLQEDQYAVQQATYKATLDASDVAALEALVHALQNMIANIRRQGGAVMRGSSAADQWNQIGPRVVSTVGSRKP